MLLRRRHVVYLLILMIMLTFAASYAWENGFEELISNQLGIPYSPEFESSERWAFILTTTTFAAVAQVVPSAVLFILTGQLSFALQRAVDSERRSLELAFSDPLTGLANRRGLQTEIENRFEPKLRFNLLLIDLDRFKSVNDTYGHAVGDELLKHVATRMRHTIGPSACSARLGGDEFAVLVPGDLETASAVAADIIAQIQQPFTINALRLQAGCSIGLSSADDASDASELLKQSDLALYDAKRNGGGNASCYRPGMLERLLERSNMETDLRVALEEGHFHLLYQPILRLHDNQIAGYEALIRWHHPTSGVISPVKFIPLAEQTGLIISIGEWVLREACRQAACWPVHHRVSVNVSPVQFRSPLLLAHITSALAESGLPPSRLEIELTETAMVEDGTNVSQILKSLRTLGVSVAMDDFGTGYSSLAHLRDFPLDRIKIDRSFVATAHTDRHSMAVLRGIIQISHELGTLLVGEGVETEEQLEMLRSLGCDCVQGYLIGQPAAVSPQHHRLSA